MSLRGTWCTYSIISPCSNKTDKRWSQYPAAERKRAKAHFSGSTGDVKRREIPAQKQRNKQRDKKTKTELWRGTSLISRGKRRYTQGKKNWIKRAPAQTKEERRRIKNKPEKRKATPKQQQMKEQTALSHLADNTAACAFERGETNAIGLDVCLSPVALDGGSPAASSVLLPSVSLLRLALRLCFISIRHMRGEISQTTPRVFDELCLRSEKAALTVLHSLSRMC